MGELALSPNPKQAEFFRARSRFVAYGGARGGGKSWAVRHKAALLALRYPGIRILLLRRTLPELRENHILPLRAMLRDAAEYRETEKAFLFPGGSRLRFGYCDNESDVLQYQGQEYDVIFLDEATQFTEFQFQTLTACLRGADDFPKRFYLTCNPGGAGHEWVKRLFITREYRRSERREDYTFIQANVYDNKALLEKDPEYVRMLENLPGEIRKAWLEGSWDVYAGQYFPEFQEEIHVTDPFPIPGWWRRYFAMDYGLDMLAGYWIAMDDAGRAFVYREIFQPDLIISAAAERIRSLTGAEPVEAWLAPPDLWNRRQDTGRSVAEIFADHGIPLTKAKNDRIQGWLGLKEWLRPMPGDGKGRLRIFPACQNLIRSFSALLADPKRPGDCAAAPHEYTHGPDAIRYFVAGRPMAAVRPGREDPGDRYDRQVASFLNFGV